MNIYGIIILAALLLTTIVDTVAEWMNLRALSPLPPEGFEDVFDGGEYRRSQDYARARTRFGFFATSFDLVVTLAFWFCGGFARLDAMVRNWGWGYLIGGVVYIAILVAGKAILDLPFGAYATFVIEERFGFNKTSLGVWLLDLMKTAALGLLLGAPLLAGILWFFASAGAWAWLYCWITMAAFMLVMQYLAPTFIMPLFNTFTPLPDGELLQAITAYAAQVRYPLAGVFVMDGSKRSSKSNAYFTGFGRKKRIVLFDTLIDKHAVSELVAILAHEIGHYKKKHIPRSLVTGILLAGVEFWLLSVFLREPALSQAFFVNDTSIHTGLIFFALLFTPVNYLLGIVQNGVSRRHEFQADRYAVETTGDPVSFAAALKKLAASNLSNLTPHGFTVFLHYSHPPLTERIRAIAFPREIVSR
jgi:STE24 endopeptidase